MLVFTAVNVARGHFGYCDIGFVQPQISSVVGKHRHSVNSSCTVAIEHDDLAATRRIVCVTQRFAVHSHIAQGFFNDAVRLTRNNKTIFGNADVQTLSAATERKQHFVWLVGTCSCNCYRTIKLANCLSKCTDQIGTSCILASNDSGNHFRISGNRLGNLEPVAHFDIGMVIDITVERRNQIWHCSIYFNFFAVDWMRICF